VESVEIRVCGLADYGSKYWSEPKIVSTTVHSYVYAALEFALNSRIGFRSVYVCRRVGDETVILYSQHGEPKKETIQWPMEQQAAE